MTKTVTLGEICKKILSGGTPSTEKAEYWNGTVPWITSADIQDRFNTTPRKFLTEKAGADVLPAGNILVVTRVGLGKVVVNQQDLAFSQDLQGLILKPGIDNRYLVYVLSERVQRFKTISRGATIKGVTREDLVNIQIPLPPLPKQRRIAALLDHADALRQKDRQLLAHYDKLAQSVFLDLFGDPVKNEKGWEKVPFGEIGDSRLGKMLDAKQQTGANCFPYLGNSNVQWGRFKLDDLLEMDFSEKDRREFELRNGDLLICEGGEVGRTAIWREQIYNCYFQKALHRVRLDSRKAIPEYIQALMWHLSKNNGFKDFTTVATIAHLTGVKLKSMPVIIPPRPLQAHFANVIEKIERQKAVVRQQMAASEGLFGRLLQESFG